MSSNKCYYAIVDKIIAEGEHGPYAVARSNQLGIITFSLNRKVWQEEEWPEPGTCVILQKLFKKRAGWRANFGRLVQPEDQQPVASKKGTEQ
ncbi:MAG TPA: hypothetical protein VI937_00915 [Negativicutes bacterium]|nr:hypothetical protein [Negativicutes bacterium]